MLLPRLGERSAEPNVPLRLRGLIWLPRLSGAARGSGRPCRSPGPPSPERAALSAGRQRRGATRLTADPTLHLPRASLP